MPMAGPFVAARNFLLAPSVDASRVVFIQFPHVGNGIICTHPERDGVLEQMTQHLAARKRSRLFRRTAGIDAFNVANTSL